jgi:hypothetical protein
MKTHVKKNNIINIAWSKLLQKLKQGKQKSEKGRKNPWNSKIKKKYYMKKCYVL